MKTLTISMILSVAFLSAGAIAGAERTAPQHAASVSVKAGNVTVVNKNRAWPPAGHISVEPCSLRRCIGV